MGADQQPGAGVRGISHVGRNLALRATNPICAQPLSPATVRLSSKGQKTNPGGISDSIQIMALATRNLLSRAGEAVSCPELGHRLKKDRSVAPSAL